MMKRFALFFFLFVHISLNALNAQNPEPALSIVPQPLHVQSRQGEFIVKPTTAIYIDANDSDLKKMGDHLAVEFKAYTNQKLRVLTGKYNRSNDMIVLTLKNAPDSLGDEGYILTVTSNRIFLQAFKPAGLFYGLETLSQLLPADKNQVRTLAIPAVSVVDKPRYAWRGMLLDVGRHFYSVDFIKKYIDYLAFHKMNTFHWHLTEDQGWRIEIKKYPRLTEVGAWRDQTIVGHLSDQPRQYDGTRSGGFYTQEQIKDIVAYAKDKYVTVIPEIEMPGHSTAALAAYPELSCTGGPFRVSQTWGVHENVYCAGNEKTFQFLEDVLSEVIDLFPGSIIHIGGDECPKNRWKSCPKCQARIKAEGLKDEHELQSYFIKRIENFLLTKNRNIIGWDEILEGGLAPNATVMSWRGIKGGIEAAQQHHDVIMTPGEYVYLDHYQGDPSKERLAISGYTTLEKVYSYNPTPSQLTAEQAKYIKGAEGTVWTEYISTPKQIEYMMMPRMAALSEDMWTQSCNKNWEDFKRRMEVQYKRYEAMGIAYSRSSFDVQQFVRIDSMSRQAIVLLKTDTYQPEIYYTLDGSEPTPASMKYDAPFIVGRNITIKAAGFKDGKQVGKTSIQAIVVPK